MKYFKCVEAIYFGFCEKKKNTLKPKLELYNILVAHVVFLSFSISVIHFCNKIQREHYFWWYCTRDKIPRILEQARISVVSNFQSFMTLTHWLKLYKKNYIVESQTGLNVKTTFHKSYSAMKNPKFTSKSIIVLSKPYHFTDRSEMYLILGFSG